MKRLAVVVMVVVSLLAGGSVQAAQAPAFINFQSILYDDGGNPLSDGSIGLTFRVTDISGGVLYEERQTLEVVKGAISALIGNGLDANGAPAGGLPLAVLDPSAGRYLEVAVDGFSPQAAMEIVSVPYALYATKALGAAPGAIDGEGIADGAITAEHFAKDALDDIGDALATDGGMVSWSVMRETDGASQVGVRSGFTYSGGNTVQGVLQDFDRAIDARESRIEVVDARINQEIADRQAADDDKVSRDGDAINGDLAVCGDMTVNCGGSVVVNQTDIYQTAMNNLSYFGGLKVIAWGSVDSDGTIIDGWNASMGSVVAATGSYEVRFGSVPGDANYAVMVTCVHDGTAPCLGSVSDKTAVSFLVRMASMGAGFSEQSFDFVVLDRQ